jgi:hypothetical protein
MPRKIPSPVWRIGEVLPCIGFAARTTSPPYACPIDWCPRQTPRIGILDPSSRIVSTDTPASVACTGPAR